MDQYTETQYDDDLTIGTEDYDDSYYTDADDLFAFASDDESPISRLRSLVLSIDWEITDEVLTQFNEELADLKDVWAGDKVNLIYVQALEKISRYIYQRKADAHPNAIKLLLSLYYNLEKIVSDQDLSDSEKHELLTEDIKRFENLKKVIAKKPNAAASVAPTTPKPEKPAKQKAQQGDSAELLLKLKAIVLGIDWEITDQDLSELKAEVLRLEKIFSTSRPKLILLQGIGTLGAYIKVKKSNAHADAFKVLHLFYESLEKIVAEQMTLEEEKTVLFPAVEKFNDFKSLLGPTISPEAISRNDEDDNEEEDDEELTASATGLSPALADYEEENVVGFQEEEERKTLGEDQGVLSKIDDFFRDDSFPEEAPAAEVAPEVPEEKSSVDEALSAFDKSFGDDQPDSVSSVSAEIALQGVDVEYDDDDEEDDDGLPGGAIAGPALSGDRLDEDESGSDAVAAVSAEEDDVSSAEIDGEIPASGEAIPAIEADVALQGVAVETEADDDSDLDALPRDQEGLAPALLDSEEESSFSAGSLQNIERNDLEDEELTGTLANFFGGEEEEESGAKEEIALDVAVPETEPEVAAEEPVESLMTTDEAESKEPEDEWPGADLAGVEEEVETSLENELEEQIDDFFAQENDSEPEPALGTVDTGDTFDVDTPDKEDFPVFDEEEGEEVVFALADDESVGSADSDDHLVPEFSDTAAGELGAEPTSEGDEEMEAFLDETFSGQEDVAAVPVAQIDSQALTETGVDAAFSSDLFVQESVEPTLYQRLLECVESIALELDDKVVSGLKQEIHSLQQDAISFQEKMLLQLLTTITQHIDSYRYEASAESFTLLREISSTLVDCAGADVAATQDKLFSETAKVLQWQQDMLHKQVVVKGGNLTFAAPIRSDESGANIDDAQMGFGAFEEADETEDIMGDAAIGGSEDIWDSEVDSLTDDVFGSGMADDSSTASIGKESDLKTEIDKLRQTLQDEIAQLRRELLSK